MSKNTLWQRTGVQGLYRNGQSGIYYGRWKVRGKTKWQSLETPIFDTAKFRHRQETDKIELQRGNRNAVETGEALMGALLDTYSEQIKGNTDLKEGTRKRNLTTVKYITKTWPELRTMKPQDVSTVAIAEWTKLIKSAGSNFTPNGAKESLRGNSSSSVNKAVSALREIMEMARLGGIITINPVVEKSEGVRLRKRVTVTPLVLPSDTELACVLHAMETNGARGGWGIEAADFCRFLAFTGMRVGEAGRATWQDVNMSKRQLKVQGTKSDSSVRTIPLFPDLEKLLAKLTERRKSAARFAVDGVPVLSPKDSIFRISECQNTIDSACEKLGVARFTHHNLRDLFATKCIESGVDIPTVARWLGHADGGALLMQRYANLRDTHSQAQASKVSFGGGL